MSKRQPIPDPPIHNYNLHKFHSNRVPQYRIFALRTLVGEVCDSMGPQLVSQSIRTEIDVPRDQYVSADRDMIRQALLHLTLNALDAMPNGGELVITSTSMPGTVELEVADSGEGLSDEARCGAFEPHFTTKANGAGLGLTVAQQITAVHGGDITAMNCPEGGAAFTLRIPQVAVRKAAA